MQALIADSSVKLLLSLNASLALRSVYFLKRENSSLSKRISNFTRIFCFYRKLYVGNFDPSRIMFLYNDRTNDRFADEADIVDYRFRMFSVIDPL